MEGYGFPSGKECGSDFLAVRIAGQNPNFNLSEYSRTLWRKVQVAQTL